MRTNEKMRTIGLSGVGPVSFHDYHPSALTKLTHLLTSMMVAYAKVAFSIGMIGVGCGVGNAQPNVILSANPSSSSYGQSVKLTATVADPLIPSAQLLGEVSFMDGVVLLNTTKAKSGVASLNTRKLSGGIHSITATYDPTGSQPTVSNEVSLQVNVAASTTTISSTILTVLHGKPGSIRAKVAAVAPGFGVPTGTIDFYLDPYDANNPYPYVPYVPLGPTGTALFDFSYFSGPGTYTVTAVYSGDSNFASSVSSMIVQTVLANAPTASVSYSPDTVVVGVSSTLTVSATNPTSSLMPSVALGVMPAGGSIAILQQPTGGSCRAARVTTGTLYYCSFSLSAGATKSLKLKVTSSTAGTFTATGYARNVDSGDETSATAKLTVQ
jgi:Bacterial Ig-like domain (group 3)